MTTELPRHVGRQVAAETGYALICNAAPDGNPHTGAICGRPATHHVRWTEATTVNGLACDEDLGFALNFGPFDVHSTENSACGMPGAHWVPREGNRPSFCMLPTLDEEPALAGAATVGASSGTPEDKR
ncbi:hypothetical protein I0C86_40770 [Plantactinospora sp. S1510]|uniref:Uncharacterized protein n=1 Tax=Plantactinospora alkalitolerans TaxID=2789879 RepID=A0ABS0H9Q9_9ACTN|nr:hypothetical protein [Plantactinospora alkalitolerans]MBF9135215.1 hypothetical protein [Plantactinospora alkalitolerans]